MSGDTRNVRATQVAPAAASQDSSFQTSAPAISLPKGGGAIRGIGEKFSANPVTGTGSLSVPIATSPGRAGFGPQLSLSYDSGAGNGLFGLGWNLSLPAITRKTDKGLPRYRDEEESDVFILAGAEDLVPVLDADGRRVSTTLTVHATRYELRAYRPRIEGLFALIERWTQVDAAGNVFWRTISRDNVTTWYGKSADSRIADPADAARIFQWVICETHDDKGNVVTYHYLPESEAGVVTSGVEEANRTRLGRTANRYLDRIRYGNTKPYVPALAAGTPWRSPGDVPGQHWMFEVVFDYTRPSDATTPDAATANPARWRVRADPFSSHRAGFEVRNYRLCRRVLMFHHFAELGAAGYLVRSTDFDYIEPPALEDAARAGYTVLESVTQRAWQKRTPEDSGYKSRQWPPVTFAYSRPVVGKTVQTIAAAELENLPVGTQGPGYRWMDLDGEGLSGVLAEHAGGWYYKPNLGDGTFGPMRVIAAQPASAAAAGSRHQFMDLSGNGEVDLVDFTAPTPGFHARDRDAGWKRHVPFANLPNIDWQDPNLRFVDLTGDGLAEALVTEHEVFTWYPSLDERGFAAAERTFQPAHEDDGPRLVFADGTQTIFLADMCGDGLTDLVRIRNGEVCYWPNLGYGRFGRKVTFGNSPHFDHPDLFDANRLRLTDIDGSGPIDIIYLGRGGAQIYFNRSGNSLSDALIVELPIATENLGAVQVADLLGNGTACLVWNSHLPADSGRTVRYIDLMGGAAESRAEHRSHEKPHLLIGTRNNLGGSTEIEYTPSTRFYLQDKLAGQPWITRLPFPVHCVSRVTVRDRWRGTAFSSTYSYHHGYFDGPEREFRGFGRVEQVDVEDYGRFERGNADSPYITSDKTLYQPPVKTVTWYHTGAAVDRQRILGQFETEYFPRCFADRLSQQSGAFVERALPEPGLPAGLNTEEWREALRACKGMVLRQEVYELDVDDLTGALPRHTPVRLFSAATHNCNIQRLQPRTGTNRHAVFLVTESEAISYQYELEIPKGSSRLEPDPRIAHTLNLVIDEYGHVVESAAAVYPRIGVHADVMLTPPQLALISQVQRNERHLALNSTKFTRDIKEPHARRLRVPCQNQAWEVTGISPAGRYFTLDELRSRNLSGVGASELSYHQVADGTPQKRLVECARSLFFADDLATHRPFGEHGRLGLAYESYKLALTKKLIESVYADTARVGAAVAALEEQSSGFPVSGYCRADGLFAGHPITPEPLENQYWMASGRAGFEADAAGHFYLPERYTDPFGNITRLAYDAQYDLFIESSVDAKGNTVRIAHDAVGKPRFDYRVLAPVEMVDASGNHSETIVDIRGLVVAAAVKGKRVNGAWQGDHLDGWPFERSNPTDTEVAAFCLQPDFDAAQKQQARTWLGTATTRFVYHFGESPTTTNPSGRMAGACAFAREVHAGQPGGDTSPLQVALECSDGSGAVLMKKVQAEAAAPGGPLRWIVNGLTVLNNKGKPVKQFEPAFSATFGCELPQANGVSTTTYYDASGRPMRVEMPDGTFSRVEFSPWHVRTFDANDTVKESRWYRERLAGSAEDARAARLAAAHADTPAETHLDSLGREVIAIAHNRTDGVDEKYLTFTKLDAEGKPLWIRDARGHLVMQYVAPAKANNDPSDVMPAGTVPCYDIAGNLLYQHSMDAGDRWMLMDAAGKPMLAWDVNETPQGGAPIHEERVYATKYDALHRPIAQWLAVNGSTRVMVERYEYQDADRDDASNLNGQLIEHYDPSGRMETKRRDFSGNVQEVRRTLNNAPEASLIDWQTDLVSQLEVETHVQITEHDAMGRMTRMYNWHCVGEGARASYLPRYNERGALVAEKLEIRTAGAIANAIQEIRYDAKGQKTHLKLGNGTVTEYTYDDQTFRLMQLKTRRAVPAGDKCSNAFLDPAVIQDLRYTYDPVGNITQIFDAAQAVVHFDNQRIDPVSRYEYDALYRLVLAEGKEGVGGEDAPTHVESSSLSAACPAPDPAALRNYTQHFRYDRVGNIEQMRHVAANGNWTRDYACAFDDLAQPASNRLWQTWTGGDRDNAVTYHYDTHGSMLNLTNAPDEFRLQWDQCDMIRGINLGGGGTAHYQYDSGKQRTRKRIVNQNGLGGYWERIYLGGYERYRRYNGDGSKLLEEIESHHLFEGEQRVLLVDDVVVGSNPQTLFRYQYSNHLGSACLELDARAEIISYEEYHPYGTSAYRMMKRGIEVSANRYRYTGMERDEESGLAYHSARYYAPWTGRWTGCDPAGVNAGINVFCYCDCSPSGLRDYTGRQGSGFVGDVVSGSKALFSALDTIATKAGELPLKVQDLHESLWGTNSLTPISRAAAGINGAVVSTGVTLVGGLLLLGPGVVLLPGALTEVPEQLRHGASEMKEGFDTRDSDRLFMGTAEVSGAVGTVAGACSLVVGGVKGARGFVRSIGEGPAEGVAAGGDAYAREVTRQQVRSPTSVPPLPPVSPEILQRVALLDRFSEIFDAAKARLDSAVIANDLGALRNILGEISIKQASRQKYINAIVNKTTGRGLNYSNAYGQILEGLTKIGIDRDAALSKALTHTGNKVTLKRDIPGLGGGPSGGVATGKPDWTGAAGGPLESLRIDLTTELDAESHLNPDVRFYGENMLVKGYLRPK